MQPKTTAQQRLPLNTDQTWERYPAVKVNYMIFLDFLQTEDKEDDSTEQLVSY